MTTFDAKGLPDGAGAEGEPPVLVALGYGAEAELAGPDALAEDAGPGAGAAGAGAPEPPEPPDPPEKPVPELLVAMELSPLITSVPGLGKTTFSPSLVVQPLPRLQVNMSGRELRALSRPASCCARRRRLGAEPSMVTRAQFMYISRLPTKLNQVHARSTSLEEGASFGTVKS